MSALKVLKLAAAVVIAFLAVAQAFRIDKSNPPIESDVQAPPQAGEKLIAN